MMLSEGIRKAQVCLRHDDNLNSRKLCGKAQRNSKFWLHSGIKDLKYILTPGAVPVLLSSLLRRDENDDLTYLVPTSPFQTRQNASASPTEHAEERVRVEIQKIATRYLFNAEVTLNDHVSPACR
jgi:hypothetical protein